MLWLSLIKSYVLYVNDYESVFCQYIHSSLQHDELHPYILPEALLAISYNKVKPWSQERLIAAGAYPSFVA